MGYSNLKLYDTTDLGVGTDFTYVKGSLTLPDKIPNPNQANSFEVSFKFKSESGDDYEGVRVGVHTSKDDIDRSFNTASFDNTDSVSRSVSQGETISISINFPTSEVASKVYEQGYCWITVDHGTNSNLIFRFKNDAADPPAVPNPQVVAVDAKSDILNAGGSADVDLVVENTGTKEATNIDASVIGEKVGDGSQFFKATKEIASLGAGSRKTLTFTGVSIPPTSELSRNEVKFLGLTNGQVEEDRLEPVEATFSSGDFTVVKDSLKISSVNREKIDGDEVIAGVEAEADIKNNSSIEATVTAEAVAFDPSGNKLTSDPMSIGISGGKTQTFTFDLANTATIATLKVRVTKPITTDFVSTGVSATNDSKIEVENIRVGAVDKDNIALLFDLRNKITEGEGLTIDASGKVEVKDKERGGLVREISKSWDDIPPGETNKDNEVIIKDMPKGLYGVCVSLQSPNAFLKCGNVEVKGDDSGGLVLGAYELASNDPGVLTAGVGFVNKGSSEVSKTFVARLRSIDTQAIVEEKNIRLSVGPGGKSVEKFEFTELEPVKHRLCVGPQGVPESELTCKEVKVVDKRKRQDREELDQVLEEQTQQVQSSNGGGGASGSFGLDGSTVAAGVGLLAVGIALSAEGGAAAGKSATDGTSASAASSKEGKQ